MDIYKFISENINEIIEKDNIREILKNNKLKRYFSGLSENEMNIRILTLYISYLLTYNSPNYKYTASAA